MLPSAITCYRLPLLWEGRPAVKCVGCVCWVCVLSSSTLTAVLSGSGWVRLSAEGRPVWDQQWCAVASCAVYGSCDVSAVQVVCCGIIGLLAPILLAALMGILDRRMLLQQHVTAGPLVGRNVYSTVFD